MMISAVMLTGESKPALARDTMFAVLMIILSGMVGLPLLLGFTLNVSREDAAREIGLVYENTEVRSSLYHDGLLILCS